jgi:toxoflavin biosynthesis protein ToxD
VKLTDVADSPHFREHAALAALDRVHVAGEHSLRALVGAAGDAAVMAQRVEDPMVPLPARLAAGVLLALVGDPRLGPAPATSFVPGGRVRIGLPPDAVEAAAGRWRHVGVQTEWIEKETPEHTVILKDFWICTYPVTNGEYREFLADTGHPSRPATWYLGAYPWDRANHPVAGVRAADADAYAAWLSRRTGHPWRLPTEAEWEHAAKGADRREFPWGDTFSPDAGNTRESGVHTTSPVGAFPAGRSPYGVHDMGGNVEEYVADCYAPYPAGPSIADHLVESMGEYRVSRGGSFARFGDLARTRRRHGAFPGPLYPVGFRLATSKESS